jgi:hypothetical protein
MARIILLIERGLAWQGMAWHGEARQGKDYFVD